MQTYLSNLSLFNFIKFYRHIAITSNLYIICGQIDSGPGVDTHANLSFKGQIRDQCIYH